MRRTQPKCINFILTGYPAFETALQAIRNQVDDYLVKPANVQELVSSLQRRLDNPQELHTLQIQPMAVFLRAHAAEIQQRVLLAMKSHPRLGALPLSDQQRADHIPVFLNEMVRHLESEHSDEAMHAILDNRESCPQNAAVAHPSRKSRALQPELSEPIP